jgi:YggT family protein
LLVDGRPGSFPRVTVVPFLDLVIATLRLALFWVAALLFVIFAIDWLVRTRRLNPFGPVARFFRRAVDPLLLPVERQVIRRGGLPSQAPWWALVIVVVGGILLVVALQFVRDNVRTVEVAAAIGSRGLLVLIIEWVFGILKLAIIVRVIASWLGLSTYRWWLRWSVTLTDWLVRPLRGLVPPIGMIDVTPIVAYLVLWALEYVVLRVVV